MSISLHATYRLRQLEALVEISRALTSRLDVPSLLRSILGYVAELTGAEVGYVALTTAQGTLRVAAGYGLPSTVFNALAPYLAQRRPQQDFWNDQELQRQLALVVESSGLALAQTLALPLVIEDKETVGGIFLFRTGSVAFTAADRAVLRDFADLAAIAVRNARTVEALRWEKARLEAVLETSPTGIMILDPNLRVLVINRALSRLVGAAQHDAVGEPCSVVMRLQNTTGDHLCQADRPPPPAEIWYGEGDIIRLGRKRVTVGVSYSPLFDRSGQLSSIVVTVTDITRFREAEELKSTFISVISHELKTPVSLIKGYAGTLAREDAHWDEQTVREIGLIIEDESDRLNELINNLLDASRIQAGALTLEPEPVSLAQVARVSVERWSAQTSKHTFVLDFPPELPPVLAEERRLRQVFDNLISNAIKYAPNGGAIRVGASVENGSVVAHVSDEGIGIPPEEREYLFQRFYRADSGLRRDTQGVGLGLFLVKAIVEAHGGRVWLESQPGEGATFYFSLPIADTPNAE